MTEEEKYIKHFMFIIKYNEVTNGLDYGLAIPPPHARDKEELRACKELINLFLKKLEDLE